MPVYTVSYTDGSRSVSGGQATATDLFEAIEQAQKWAENLAIDAPESEWSQWMIEIIDEAGNKHTRSLAAGLNPSVDNLDRAADNRKELSVEEVDRLSMEAINSIIARLPIRDYHIKNSRDGTSSHVFDFGQGAKFEVIYDSGGRPSDFRAEGVRFEQRGDLICVMAVSASRTRSGA